MTAARRQFLMFLAVGGLNTLVGYAIFAALVLTGASPTMAAIGATVLGVLFNFGSTGRVVFGSRDIWLLPRFVAVYALHALANIGLLRLAGSARITALAAEIVILPVLAVASFLLMRRFVFVPGGRN